VGGCPLCDGNPVVLVALRHPAMRRFTRELLRRECRCWTPIESQAGASLASELATLAPELLVMDAADFSDWCQDGSAGFPPARVVVVGPEPDPSYRQAARARGAASWVARERLGEDLAVEMRRVLGCTHHPCPVGSRRQPELDDPGDVA
jgi:DNA-binding NarL/FixJ family response regulator